MKLKKTNFENKFKGENCARGFFEISISLELNFWIKIWNRIRFHIYKEKKFSVFFVAERGDDFIINLKTLRK